MLREKLGRIRLADIDRETLTAFGQDRAKEAPAR
jgi:hypothetical protein